MVRDVLAAVLDRLEKAAADRFTLEGAERRLEIRCEDLALRLSTAQEGNRRRDRDMKAAEDKIGEWAEYASQLRSAINAIDPRALKRKRIVLPDMPAPLETEIPF